MSASSISPFRQELRQLQNAHPLFQRIHPFWNDCFRGRLPVTAIQRWAMDVYPVIRDFSQLYLQVAAKCTDERVLTFLAETIYEETGSGVAADSHPTLFRSFMCSLGLSEIDVPEKAATPTGREFFDFAWNTVRAGSFLEGLTLVGLGIERPLPMFFAMIARAFQRDFGLSDGAVRFFAVHTVADVKHSQIAARIVGDLAQTETQQRQVRAVLERLWNVQAAQLDALHAAARIPASPGAAFPGCQPGVQPVASPVAGSRH